MRYQVQAMNKRGYMQESEITKDYISAFNYAMECKDSGQYKVIIILYDNEEGINAGKFFLHSIIK